MSEVFNLKDQLINELWLPYIKRGGDIFYPRLKKNKRMKLLTLTSDKNFQEIFTFQKNNLTDKEYIFAWTYSHIKKLRLETELSPAKIFGAIRYDNSASSSSFPISSYFPFDIINLDFSSQDPGLESGRIEREIESFERTIKLQREESGVNFIIIYTTLLNSNNLSYKSIAMASNNIPISGWPGLTLNEFPSKIKEQKEKMRCIEAVLAKLCLKYNYNIEIEKKHFSLKEGKYMYSIVMLLCHKEA